METIVRITALELDFEMILMRSHQARGDVRLDDLESLSHCQLVGIARQVYFDVELMKQVKLFLEVQALPDASEDENRGQD